MTESELLTKLLDHIKERMDSQDIEEMAYRELRTLLEWYEHLAQEEHM
jgi:hypothetical protein